MKRIWPQIPYPETVLAQVSGKILQEEPERHYTLFPELPPWLEADCYMAKVSEVPRKDLLGMLSLRDMWEKIIDDDNGSRLTYLTTMLTGHIYIILDLKVTSKHLPPRELVSLIHGNISLLRSNHEKAIIWLLKEGGIQHFFTFFCDSRFKVENPFPVRPPFVDVLFGCLCSPESRT